MAKVKDSMFTAWELSAEETLQANVLNETQKRLIQNKLAELAEQRLELVPDPEHIQYFVQQEAHLKGKIEALQELLAEHDDAVEYFNQLQQAQA